MRLSIVPITPASVAMPAGRLSTAAKRGASATVSWTPEAVGTGASEARKAAATRKTKSSGLSCLEKSGHELMTVATSRRRPSSVMAAL